MLPADFDLVGCDEVSARLSEFLDDELEEPSRGRIALHIAMCAGCARFAVELAETVQALHALHGSA